MSGRRPGTPGPSARRTSTRDAAVDGDGRDDDARRDEGTRKDDGGGEDADDSIGYTLATAIAETATRPATRIQGIRRGLGSANWLEVMPAVNSARCHVRVSGSRYA